MLYAVVGTAHRTQEAFGDSDHIFALRVQGLEVGSAEELRRVSKVAREKVDGWTIRRCGCSDLVAHHGYVGGVGSDVRRSWDIADSLSI